MRLGEVAYEDVEEEEQVVEVHRVTLLAALRVEAVELVQLALMIHRIVLAYLLIGSIGLRGDEHVFRIGYALEDTRRGVALVAEV